MKYALGLMIAACLAPSPAHPTSAAPASARPLAPTLDSVVDLRPLEVRLRKLHLVRPDLQRFPIPYDTVC